MSDKEFGPCRIEDKKVIPCIGLSSTIESQGCKGPVADTLMNLKTGKTKTCVSLYTGKYRKNGLVMNFCPFCGENISSHLGKKP